jgi:sec-independent protein translocase protein TatC
MSFLEHLEELRKRLIRVAVTLAVAFGLCLVWARDILAFLLRPILPMLGQDRPVFLDLTEPFLLYMKVAFLTAIFVAAPILLYQAWAFITPGLYSHERRYALPFVFMATLFFVLGGAFGYYVAFPTACRFLIGIAEGFQPALRVSSLFAFESRMILAMGLVFELPTVIYFLARIGLVTAAFLWAKFKYAVLAIFVLAAIITPTPDIVTQCIFAGPMILLYLLGILVAHLVGRPGVAPVAVEPAAPGDR